MGYFNMIRYEFFQNVPFPRPPLGAPPDTDQSDSPICWRMDVSSKAGPGSAAACCPPQGEPRGKNLGIRGRRKAGIRLAATPVTLVTRTTEVPANFLKPLRSAPSSRGFDLRLGTLTSQRCACGRVSLLLRVPFPSSVERAQGAGRSFRLPGRSELLQVDRPSRTRGQRATHHLQLDLGARGSLLHRGKAAGEGPPQHAVPLQGLLGGGLQARHAAAHGGQLGPGLEQAPQLRPGREEGRERAFRAVPGTGPPGTC